MRQLIKRAREIHNRKGTLPLMYATGNYFSFRGRHVYGGLSSRVRNRLYRFKYGAAAPKPYELIYVDPADIKYGTAPRLRISLGVSDHGTHVVGGDWDRGDRHDDLWFSARFDEPTIVKFDSYGFYRSLQDHFINDVPWEETEWYQWVSENPGRQSQYEDIKTMEQRFEEIEQLYKHMKKQGYMTQRELLEKNNAPFTAKKFPRPEYREVRINIGRDGELFFEFGGRHRLSIAKLLELDRIPVRVVVRHKCWQETRQKMMAGVNNTNGNKFKKASHPDIEALIN